MLTAPTTQEENILYRVSLLNKSEENTNAQEACRVAAAGDFEWFCNSFLWTYDPREADPHKPFILWPKQKQFTDWIETLYQRSQTGEKINAVIDKPRGIGASYTLMAWVLWHYLFHDFTVRIGSRKEDYVDMKGDPDTLFAKLDYMLERLPEWLVPEQSRAYLMIRPQNSASGNSIVGESANPNFGRGGRKNAIIFDEFGFWDWSKSSWESAGEATNLRIAVSTPPESGRDSHFFKLLTGQAGKIMKFEFDWSDDPRRDKKWLDEAKGTKSEEEFAREVMKSFEGTIEGKVYAVAIRHAYLTNVGYNPDLPMFVSWDFGLDAVAMVWWQKDFATNRVFMIDCYTNSNKGIDFYAPFVTGVISSGQHEYNANELELIAKHKTWTREITHFGDPDVNKRDLKTVQSTFDYLNSKYGIYVQSKPWGGREWKDIKEKTLLLYRRLEINEYTCEPVLSAIRNAKYPRRNENSQATNEPLKPIHDWTSHYRTSVEYFADNEPEGYTTRTVVGNVSQGQERPKQPHEIEAEKIKEEMDKVNRVVTRAKTVLSTVGHTHNSAKPTRIL
jgi:hypothetical protein